MKEGRIQEMGDYETLRTNDGEFAKLLKAHIEEKARQNDTLQGKQNN